MDNQHNCTAVARSSKGKKTTKLSMHLLVHFYHCSIKSRQTYCITAWCAKCSAADKKALQHFELHSLYEKCHTNTVLFIIMIIAVLLLLLLLSAEDIIGHSLFSLNENFRSPCLLRSSNILRDTTHPSHHFFTLSPSWRCYMQLRPTPLND